MTELDQKQLGKTLWSVADPLRGAMNADNFRGRETGDNFDFSLDTIKTQKKVLMQRLSLSPEGV
jgi:hypothetical protein